MMLKYQFLLSLGSRVLIFTFLEKTFLSYRFKYIYLSEYCIKDEQAKSKAVVCSTCYGWTENPACCHIHETSKDEKLGNCVRYGLHKQENKVDSSESLRFV